MSNPERDTLIIGLCVGFCAGGGLGAWLGYRVRRAIEQFHVRRVRREFRPASFGDVGGVPRAEQDARAVLRKPRVIPLEKRDPNTGRTRSEHVDMQRIPREHDQEATRREAEETARMLRAEALATLTNAGYKKAAANTALDTCTLAERAGGLESWVAAALRHAATRTGE